MAAIQTDEDFSLAVGYLVDNGQLPVTGERYSDNAARKVYDLRPGETVDITPVQAILEAALDAARAAIELEQDRADAAAALINGRVYLRAQLEMQTPSSVAVIVGNIKPIVDGNIFLTRMMTNQIGLMNGAFGWTLDLNPNTALNRQRYLMAVEALISLF